MQVLSLSAVEETIYSGIRKVKPSLAQFSLSPTTRFDSLGLESIERIMVVFEIEEAYGISIVDQQLDTFRTIAEARDLVMKLAAAPQTR